MDGFAATSCRGYSTFLVYLDLSILKLLLRSVDKISPSFLSDSEDSDSQPRSVFMSRSVKMLQFEET